MVNKSQVVSTIGIVILSLTILLTALFWMDIYTWATPEVFNLLPLFASIQNVGVFASMGIILASIGGIVIAVGNILKK